MYLIVILNFIKIVNKTFRSCKINHQKQLSKGQIEIVDKYCNPRFKRDYFHFLAIRKCTTKMGI